MPIINVEISDELYRKLRLHCEVYNVTESKVVISGIDNVVEDIDDYIRRKDMTMEELSMDFYREIESLSGINEELKGPLRRR